MSRRRTEAERPRQPPAETIDEAAVRLACTSRLARGLPAVIDDDATYRRLGYLIQRADRADR